MTQLSEILRSTQDNIVSQDVCFALIIHQSADSVLPLEFQVVTTIGIPNNFQCILVGIGHPRCRLNDQGRQQPRSNGERRWRIPTSLRLATACCLTPAAWPLGRMLSSTGSPCPSAASWAAIRRFASALYDVAREGVIGFGYFCRNKSGSAAGPKPGNTRTCK
jgi:hypothetical protein